MNSRGKHSTCVLGLTVREYASTLLAAQGESEQTLAHVAHASFYLELAEDTSTRFGDALHHFLKHNICKLIEEKFI